MVDINRSLKSRASMTMKRTNLFLVALGLAICTLYYFLGFWRQPRITVPEHLSVAVSLHPPPPFVPPDFASRQRADDAFADELVPEERDFDVPPCAANLSEYTPCEDIQRSLRFARERMIYRERHCPAEPQEALKCRIPAPYGYRIPFRWPESRGLAWFANVPHKHLTVEKKVQNWVHYEDGKLRFPGGGTMFPDGADAYIDEIGKLIDLWGGSIRTAIDTGCGVASWGAYLMSREIVTMSFAPKDSHEAQVQFALERGIPAMIGILASMRLPYPARAFDMAHCSRCLIPWAQYDGLFMIEIDRILRPGGYWVLSGPPVNWQKYWKSWNRNQEDVVKEQTQIEAMAARLCWKKVKQVGDIAVWQKPTNHVHCKMSRRFFKRPLFCQNQDPDTAWYTKMEDCLTPLPNVTNIKEVAGGQLAKWPARLTSVPPRISSGSVDGVTAEAFREDTELWKRRVEHYESFHAEFAERGRYRNLLDMNAGFGGFAAALVDRPVWVMNVVPEKSDPNTLAVIYERGLIGTYQDWCEAMSTYPRSYDFIHADSVLGLYKHKCKVEEILLEMDRVLRPEGGILLRDDLEMIVKVMKILKRMQYSARIVKHEDGDLAREKILMAKKLYWTAPNHTFTSS